MSEKFGMNRRKYDESDKIMKFLLIFGDWIILNNGNIFQIWRNIKLVNTVPKIDNLMFDKLDFI